MDRCRYAHARSRPRSHGRLPRSPRRGIVLIVVVVLLLVVELIVVSIVLGGARDHDLTIRRIQSVEFFYASEAGINMAIREIAEDADEDGDTKIGGISDDSNAANDPALGNARVLRDRSHGRPRDDADQRGSLRRDDADGSSDRPVDNPRPAPPVPLCGPTPLLRASPRSDRAVWRVCTVWGPGTTPAG